MSRTTKDLPYRIRVQNAPTSNTEEFHYGCDRDPEGRKRYVRTETEIIDLPAHWHQKTVVVGHTLWLGEEITALRWVFESEHIENRVRIFETVPCDIDAPERRRGIQCGRSLIVNKHHCHWGKGGRRLGWYAPERREERESLQQMAHEYNTHGEISTDDPWTPTSPAGLWGGGWID